MFTPTLNFRLNTSKINKEGLAPVYLRVTINGTRSEISTKGLCGSSQMG
jgi:integrase/recombinase XerD